MRLISGKFRLIPFELGFESEYLGNPFVVARELALGRRGEIQNKHFITHGSAFLSARQGMSMGIEKPTSCWG